LPAALYGRDKQLDGRKTFSLARVTNLSFSHLAFFSRAFSPQSINIIRWYPAIPSENTILLFEEEKERERERGREEERESTVCAGQ